MSRTLNLLCLFGILANNFLDHAEARSSRRLEGEGIRGGTYAKEDQFPYQISLESDGKSICGGSILTEQFIITAAHCVIDEDGSFTNQSLKIIAGTRDLKSTSKRKLAVDVAKVYVPKEYDPTVLEYGDASTGDIAILQLEDNLDFESNSKLDKVKLPENNDTDYVGVNATISGFGWNHVDLIYDQGIRDYIEANGKGDNKLRFAKAKVMTYETCKNSYISSLQLNRVKHLCAALFQRDENKPEGLCNGDSGGGLIYNGTIIGVVSQSPNGCREMATPAIYTRISYYVSFINNVIDGKIDKNIRTATLVISS